MTRIALALAMLLTVLAGPALAGPPDPAPEPAAEASVVLVWFDNLRYRSDLRVDLPDDEEDLCLCEVYEADVAVLRKLDGPSVPERLTVLFIGHALGQPDEYGYAMIMSVRRDGQNRPWAGMAWDFVDSDSCIGPNDAGGWSVLEPSSRAVTCTRVRRLL